MSQVRVLPGEPVFSMFFDIPTATNLQVCLTLVGLLPFDAVYHPLHGCIPALSSGLYDQPLWKYPGRLHSEGENYGKLRSWR